MTGGGYVTGIDFAAGALLVTAVVILWRRDLAAMIRLLAVQGVALGCLPILSGLRRGDLGVTAIGAIVLALRAVGFPLVLAGRLRREAAVDRESAPLINTVASLLVAAALTVAAYGVFQPVVNLAQSSTGRAAPVGLAVAVIGVLMLVTRRHALAQVIGLVVLDNGIDAVAFLTTSGVPLIVELGASLDVFLALIVLGVLTGRLHAAFGTADLDELRELREE